MSANSIIEEANDLVSEHPECREAVTQAILSSKMSHNFELAVRQFLDDIRKTFKTGTK